MSPPSQPETVDVTSIVVTHNSSRVIERCLTELSGRTRELVVVDNASTDGATGIVRRAFPDARLIVLGKNTGFAAACNRGMREASARYALFVNPDAWPVGAALSTLVEAADRDESVGIVGPALINADGSPQRSVFGYPRNSASLLAFVAAPGVVSAAYATLQRVSRATDQGMVRLGPRTFLSGAALLIRRSAFDDVGGFDERFFFFSEEADLCFRMSERGWSVAFCPAAVFVHLGAASSPAPEDWRYAALLRSYLLFIAKHHGARRAERARRLLVRTLSARAAITPGRRGRELELAVARLRVRDPE